MATDEEWSAQLAKLLAKLLSKTAQERIATALERLAAAAEAEMARAKRPSGSLVCQCREPSRIAGLSTCQRCKGQIRDFDGDGG